MLLQQVLMTSLLMVGSAWTMLQELECPEECDCHYFRINWVTDCSESNLTSIPEEGLSPDTYILNMNGNNISEVALFPAGFKLRRLQLADNLLTGLSRESYGGLGLLLDADFSGNQIATVDPETFKDSPGLITLELQGNRLQPVDTPFLVSKSLLYLDLSDCQLPRLSPLFFANSTGINKLDLSGNPLTTLGPGIFDPLSNLEALKLSRCNLTHITDTALSGLVHLQRLELSENHLTRVDWTMVLGSLARLETLNLRKAEVTNLPGDAFANNTWLSSLILAENELRDLDVATTLGQNLLHLESLDLSNCHLRGPLSEDAFANATKLRTLLLSGNHLSANDLSVALAPLSFLQTLALKNCGLTRLPDNTFDRLASLERLDISYNPLNNVFTGILSPLETLEFLDMSYSNLSHISRNTFSNMNHLKRLVLSGNHLTDLEYGLFRNLTQLETLELNNCKLDHTPDAMVFVNDHAYSNLKDLRLSGNPLRIAEDEPLLPIQFSGLQVLDMSNCNLTSLPREVFSTTPNITNLKLSGNRLGLSGSSENSHLKFLQLLSHLEVLDLSYCDLTSVNPSEFAHNRNITSLKLIGNPWKCDCYIAELWGWASTTKGDLSVLVGSTTAPEDITAGGVKRKRGLLCHYDHMHEPPKSTMKIRSRDLRANRTWARYVKESGCELKQRGIFERLTSTSQNMIDQFNYDSAPYTLIVVVTTVALILAFAVIVGAGYVLVQRRRHSSKLNGLTPEVELEGAVREVEVPTQRRRVPN